MSNNKTIGHLCMAAACACWGLMAPLGKDAMMNGIPGLEMVTFRVTGGALCFWLASIVMGINEKVPPRDLLRFFLAGLFGIVFNQCGYTIGLSITSPVNASIVTTTLPIITMILAALVLREPITTKKVSGILIGAAGACTLIISSTGIGSSDGVLAGDLLCLAAQCSFAVYLASFKHLIARYSVITSMKWMITFASMVILPFSFNRMTALPWESIPATTYFETAFVVIGGTFLAYICSIHAQKILRPTVIASYNYVQPAVACGVSVAAGIGGFNWMQGLAIVLVFWGVYLVNKSKARQS